MKAAEALSTTAGNWDACPKFAGDAVLKLTLLRWLASRLHALRSEALALDDKKLGSVIDLREQQLELLRDSPLPESGQELISRLNSDPARPAPQAEPVQTIPEPLPQSLYDALGGRNKLLRTDRKWEHAITGAAFRSGWEFWTAESEVPLGEVEAWHEKLKKELWPRGVILFVESGGVHASNPKNWRGRWIVVLRPGTGNPENLPGTEWKLLFPMART